jgi:hypothetical protein
MSLLDDRDSRSALGGKERQLADQMANGARVRVRGRADPDLPTGSFRCEAMKIRVVAGCNQAATPAVATRP